MTDLDLAARAAELLQTVLYANLATASQGQPWNTPATAIADSRLTLYWSSWTEAVHSKNIAANPRAFITYYDSTRERGTNNRRCLYLQCQANVVTSQEEAYRAHELLYPGEPVDLADFFDTGLRRFYRATPQAAWLNCLSEQQLSPATVDMREAVSLDAIRAAYTRAG